MASSDASPPPPASRSGSGSLVRVHGRGLVLLVLALPGLIRLITAPSVPLTGLSVACVLLLFAAASWCKRQAARIQLTRQAPAEVRAQETFRVQLFVDLEGGAPVTGVVIADDFWAGRTPAGSSFFIPALLPGRRLCCAYPAICSASRGWQRLARVSLTVEDPLGLVSFNLTRRLQTEILVLPATRELRESRLVNHSCRTGAEEHGAQEAGAGDEFTGTREWRPGDPMRDIHWRSTAKTGVLVVREHARVVRPELVVVLHLHRPAPWGGDPRDRRKWLLTVVGWKLQTKKKGGARLLSGQAIELCIQAAASLLEWGPKAGYRTSLYLAALQPIVVEGLQSDEAVLDAQRQLAVAEPQSTGPLDVLLGTVHNRLPPGAVVAIVAPAASMKTPEATAAVLGLQSKGSRVELLLSYPEPDHDGWDDPSAELRAAGLRVHMIQNEQDISGAFSQPGLHGMAARSVGA